MMIMSLYTLPSFWLFSVLETKWSILTVSSVSAITVLNCTIVMIYATAYQLGLTLKSKKRQIIATAVVIGLIILPVMGVVIVGVKSDLLPTIGLFSALPFVSIEKVSVTTILSCLVAQTFIIVGMNYKLKNVLNQIGISESKRLLAPQSQR